MSYSLDLNYFGVIWPQWRAAAIPTINLFLHDYLLERYTKKSLTTYR